MKLRFVLKVVCTLRTTQQTIINLLVFFVCVNRVFSAHNGRNKSPELGRTTMPRLMYVMYDCRMS
jgi:hypothetical protein